MKRDMHFEHPLTVPLFGKCHCRICSMLKIFLIKIRNFPFNMLLQRITNIHLFSLNRHFHGLHPFLLSVNYKLIFIRAPYSSFACAAEQKSQYAWPHDISQLFFWPDQCPLLSVYPLFYHLTKPWSPLPRQSNFLSVP